MRVAISIVLSLFVAAFLQLSFMDDADAKKRKRSRGNPKYAAIVIDAKTGKVLHSSSAHARRYPASLTKMMTLYLVFEDLKRRKISKKSRVVMTRHAAKRPPSKLGIRPGRSISVEQAILSSVTKSANDVATALGEKLSGSEPAFARRMTKKARQLGMKNTTFKNANGLTARGQVTTAADMAKLGLALREHFPRDYRYFQTRSFKYGKRRMGNHNKLLGRVRGVDGIKTGYTRASGFNLVTSVSSKGRRIVAVVMGGRTGARRNARMKVLINQYLPKASRGASKRLVARATYSGRKAKSQLLPKIVPIPTFKPKVVALVAKAETAPAHTTAPAHKVSNPVRNRIEAAHAVSTSNGWQIQIAATDNKSKAIQLLESAKLKNKTVLASAVLYTEQIVKNGTTLYRARFTGFPSKNSARRACKVLKRKRFSCLALYN